MYLNFNILNNEVFEFAADDALLEVAERASTRNKGFAAEGKKPCVGTIWAPDEFYGWETEKQLKYLEMMKEWKGIDILMNDWGDEGWKARKKSDGTWEVREFDSSI